MTSNRSCRERERDGRDKGERGEERGRDWHVELEISIYRYEIDSGCWWVGVISCVVGEVAVGVAVQRRTTAIHVE